MQWHSYLPGQVPRHDVVLRYSSGTVSTVQCQIAGIGATIVLLPMSHQCHKIPLLLPVVVINTSCEDRKKKLTRTGLSILHVACCFKLT